MGGREGEGGTTRTNFSSARSLASIGRGSGGALSTHICSSSPIWVSSRPTWMSRIPSSSCSCASILACSAIMRGTYDDVEGALRNPEKKSRDVCVRRGRPDTEKRQKRSTNGVARILAFLSWRSLSSRMVSFSMGGRLGFGGTLKPGMGAIFLDRMGEDGPLRGYAACMCVEMWGFCSRRCRT